MSIQPDVLFIDVEMPGQTGFEVLQSLRDEIPMELIVVFYSAFDKYMIDALRASAFDFLLKPYQQDEFELVVDRIRQKMKDGDDVDEDASSVPESSSCSSESVLASQKAQDFSGMNGMLGTAAKRLAIQTISGLLMLKPDDVFSCTFDEATHLWQLKLSNGQVYKLKRQATAKTILPCRLLWLRFVRIASSISIIFSASRIIRSAASFLLLSTMRKSRFPAAAIRR